MNSNDKDAEAAAVAVAPRVTKEGIENKIVKCDFSVYGGVLTTCYLTLENGFMVTGESACASPENFNEELGRKIAYDNAFDKIWPLEGYLLREHLYQQSKN